MINPKSPQLTQLEKARYELAHAHLLNYHRLRKYGPNLFEHDGKVITIYQGEEIRRSGRDFILKHIKFFEKYDEPIFYKYCVILHSVLEAYDERFNSKTELIEKI